MSFNWQAPLISLIKTTRAKKGPAYIKKLSEAGIKNIEDLLWVMPLWSKSISTNIESCNDGDIFSGSGTIKSVRSFRNFRAKGRNRVPLSNVTAIVETQSRLIELKWFNAYPNIEKSLRSKEGTLVIFNGPIRITNEKLQVINPKLTQTDDESIIQYPTINTVPGTRINELIKKIPLDSWREIPSSISISSEKLSLAEAFKVIHEVEGKQDCSHKDEALNRIVIEEFLKEQIVIEKRKFLREQQTHQYKFKTSENEKQELIKSFDFPLTRDQKTVLDEILEDFSYPFSMSRLIQGDVGCGKTAVAFASCKIAIKKGLQAAMMAPTESLAIQLFNNAKKYFNENTRVELLIGSTKKKEKDNLLALLERGDINLIIGTHSLIQDTVKFNKLGLSIIDEQHKFGVKQRIALNNKSVTGHTIIMSATPIPRSLSLTRFGDLDVSIINEKPNGRTNIPSRIITSKTMDKFLSFLLTRLEMGEQAYVVVPAIEESETIDIENLNHIYSKYLEIFSNKNISYIHGKMSSEEKQSIFQGFKQKKIDLLIATSLIEVGIDVENATTMVVYGPERFGLSSLHQLRGRVGRGVKPGFFFMIVEKEISKESMNRLQVIEEYSNGFKIAEQDLLHRGEGDLVGVNQSGEKSRKVADIAKHGDLLEESINIIADLKKNDLEHFQKIISNIETMEEFTA